MLSFRCFPVAPYLLIFSQLSFDRNRNSVILHLFTVQKLLQKFSFLLFLLHHSFGHAGRVRNTRLQKTTVEN